MVDLGKEEGGGDNLVIKSKERVASGLSVFFRLYHECLIH